MSTIELRAEDLVSPSTSSLKSRLTISYSQYDKEKVDLEQVVLEDVWTLLK